MGRVVGSLIGPCHDSNSGAADILENQLFAYAVASSIAVVDVSTRSIREFPIESLHNIGMKRGEGLALIPLMWNSDPTGPESPDGLCPARRPYPNGCYGSKLVRITIQILAVLCSQPEKN